MTEILTIRLPVPVPAIKTISRWRVFLALFNPGAHFTTCSELQHQLYKETEATARLQADQVFRNLTEEFTSLKDLAGVRVLVFPRSRLKEVDSILHEVEAFREWVADPVRDDGKILTFKYSGYCTDASSRIGAEYQIVSVLTGLFWNIEHAAIYKPSPPLKA